MVLYHKESEKIKSYLQILFTSLLVNVLDMIDTNSSSSVIVLKNSFVNCLLNFAHIFSESKYIFGISVFK